MSSSRPFYRASYFLSTSLKQFRLHFLGGLIFTLSEWNIWHQILAHQTFVLSAQGSLHKFSRQKGDLNAKIAKQHQKHEKLFTESISSVLDRLNKSERCFRWIISSTSSENRFVSTSTCFRATRRCFLTSHFWRRDVIDPLHWKEKRIADFFLRIGCFWNDVESKTVWTKRQHDDLCPKAWTSESSCKQPLDLGVFRLSPEVINDVEEPLSSCPAFGFVKAQWVPQWNF